MTMTTSAQYRDGHMKYDNIMIEPLYCYFREAERSIDSVLADRGQWAAFVAYCEHKLGPFRLLVETITEPYTANSEGRDHFAAETIPHVGPMRLILNRILYAITKRPKFSYQEVIYINNSYNNFVNFVSLNSFESNLAVSVRTAMYNSQFIIRRNTRGNALLEKFKYVEYFNQTPYIKHLKINEIVGG